MSAFDGCDPVCADGTVNVGLVYGTPYTWGGADDPGGEMGEWGQALFNPRMSPYWGAVNNYVVSSGIGMYVGGVVGYPIGQAIGAFIGGFWEGLTGRAAAQYIQTLGLTVGETGAGATGAAGGGLGPVLKGQAGVNRAIAQIEAEGGTVVGREITVDAGGVRARADLYVRNADNTYEFVEVKNGPNARLSPNQRTGYDAIRKGGGIPRGGNAADARLPVGRPMPATPVREIWYP
jgi:hypothetical protein